MRILATLVSCLEIKLMGTIRFSIAGWKPLPLSCRGIDSRARMKTLKPASPLTATSPCNVPPNDGHHRHQAVNTRFLSFPHIACKGITWKLQIYSTHNLDRPVASWRLELTSDPRPPPFPPRNTPPALICESHSYVSCLQCDLEKYRMQTKQKTTTKPLSWQNCTSSQKGINCRAYTPKATSH